MASFFERKEVKQVTSGIVIGIITGTASIILASQYIARKASEATIARTMAVQNFNRPLRTEYVGNVGNIGNVSNVGNAIGMQNLKSADSKPKPSINIVTNEFYNDTWNPVLMHSFYGDNNEEIENLVAVHRMSDPFFDSGFKGTFNWRGAEIKLKNTVEYS